MEPVYTLLDIARATVRSFMRGVAGGINRVSGGHISPWLVTTVGLMAHIPIAWLIATNHFQLAAILLLVFGLFDTLDGELARLQGKASPAGMLLDATTDRMKEVILYMGVVYFFVQITGPHTERWALAAVAAAGGSLLVSYVKAKGETAIASSNLPHHEVNHLFEDGLMRFELRMLALILGLAFNALPFAVGIVAVAAWATAVERLIKISRKLRANA